MNLSTDNVLNIVFLKTCKDEIKIRYANSLKKCCYPISVNLIVDYKEQVMITNPKANMQCFIYYIPSKKSEYMTKL